MSGLDGWRILAHERRQRRLERERQRAPSSTQGQQTVSGRSHKPAQAGSTPAPASDLDAPSSTAIEWCVAIVATAALIGAVLLLVHIVALAAGVP